MGGFYSDCYSRHMQIRTDSAMTSYIYLWSCRDPPRVLTSHHRWSRDSFHHHLFGPGLECGARTPSPSLASRALTVRMGQWWSSRRRQQRGGAGQPAAVGSSPTPVPKQRGEVSSRSFIRLCGSTSRSSVSVPQLPFHCCLGQG